MLCTRGTVPHNQADRYTPCRHVADLDAVVDVCAQAGLDLLGYGLPNLKKTIGVGHSGGCCDSVDRGLFLHNNVNTGYISAQQSPIREISPHNTGKYFHTAKPTAEQAMTYLHFADWDGVVWFKPAIYSQTCSPGGERRKQVRGSGRALVAIASKESHAIK